MSERKTTRKYTKARLSDYAIKVVEAIAEEVGGFAELAKKLKVVPSLTHSWRAKTTVPSLTAAMNLIDLSKGRLAIEDFTGSEDVVSLPNETLGEFVMRVFVEPRALQVGVSAESYYQKALSATTKKMLERGYLFLTDARWLASIFPEKDYLYWHRVFRLYQKL